MVHKDLILSPIILTRIISPVIYKVDVSNQRKPEEIDLLHANTVHVISKGYDKNDPNVGFIFHHKLAKFTLETVAGSGLTAAELVGMTVTIRGMNTEAEFNLESADLDNETSLADLTPLIVEDGKQYEAIVLPAESLTEGKWEVIFVVNGDAYTWRVPANIHLEAGKEYVWKISVQKIPVLISGRIIDWDEITGTGNAW